jgi:hypothetical protein
MLKASHACVSRIIRLRQTKPPKQFTTKPVGYPYWRNHQGRYAQLVPISDGLLANRTVAILPVMRILLDGGYSAIFHGERLLLMPLT